LTQELRAATAHERLEELLETRDVLRANGLRPQLVAAIVREITRKLAG